MRAHDNYIYGSFAVGDLSTAKNLTGTGINCEGEAATVVEAKQYILTEDNEVATINAGMNISNGHQKMYRCPCLVSAAEPLP